MAEITILTPQAWLRCGADANSKDYDDRTALHVAYSHKRAAMIEVLEEYMAGDRDADKGLLTSQESRRCACQRTDKHIDVAICYIGHRSVLTFYSPYVNPFSYQIDGVLNLTIAWE